MPRHPIRPALLLGSLVLALSGCSRAAERSSSDGATQNWAALKGFTKIDAAGTDDVTVSIGPEFSVRAQGDADAIKALDIRVDGDTLSIKRKSGSDSLWGDHSARIAVTMPAIAGLALTGTGDLTLDRAEGKALSLSLTGTGDVEVGKVAVERLDADMTGTGTVTLAGTAQDARFELTGTGDISAEALKAGKADVTVHGTGDIDFASDGPVAIRIMGPGEVTVKGKAQCTIESSGPGEAHCGS